MKRRTLMIYFLLGFLFVPQEAAGQAAPITAEEALKKAQDDLARAERGAVEAAHEKKIASVCFQSLVESVKVTADRRQVDKPKGIVETAQAIVAAKKDLEAKTAAEQAARAKVREAKLTLLAEKAWAARQAATKADTDKAAAERDLAAKNAAATAAQAQAAAASKAAEKAAAERAVAEKAYQKAPKDKKAEAKKTLEGKIAAAKKASEAVREAKKEAEKTLSAKALAEKVAADKAAEVTPAHEAAALAHAEALGGLKPITTAQWDYAKARHLLFRAGLGGTPEEVERLVKMGPYRAVDALVEYRTIPQTNIEMDVNGWERPLAYENRLHAQARNKQEERRMNRDLTQRTAFRRWWYKRLAETPRPFEEKLVLFWHDHFATSWQEIRDSFLMVQQNQLFRRYADKYDALLHGIAQDPAMIRYLNNNENIKGNHNENLGREILELFSMGEENSANHKKDGYTEKDVRDGMTRALTGFTYDRWTGQFRFYATKHDTGTKTLLGKTGNWGPHEAVDILLKHPAPARYIVKKLMEYFVHFEPDPLVVEKLAQVLRENNYDVRPVLKNLFLSEEFYGPRALANHIKSPTELMVGTIRAFKITNINYQLLDVACMNMGQTLLEPPSVAGWPEGRIWINANLILIRYNSAVNLLQQGNVDMVALLGGQKLASPAEVVDHLAQRCLLTGLKEDKRQALIQFLGQLPPQSEWAKQRDQINTKLRNLAAMLMSMPEYQVS